MDGTARNLELMKISAALTLAQCILVSSSEKIEQDAAASLVDTLFNEYIERVRGKLYGFSSDQVA